LMVVPLQRRSGREARLPRPCAVETRSDEEPRPCHRKSRSRRVRRLVPALWYPRAANSL
jgi:hypothetical protein